MSKIDVLLLTDNSLDTIGGSEESTKIIINGLKDEFTLGVIQPGNIENKIPNVRYYKMTEKTRIKHLIKNPFAFLKYIWHIKRIISKENPKIIHTQAQVSLFIIALLLKLKLIPKCFKLAHTERGLYIRYNTFFKKIFYSSMKEVDVLITTTNYNVNFWKSSLENKGLTLEYKVIENTAGELFEVNNNIKKQTEDKLVIGFAGRYSKQKNWPLAVEIIEKLHKKIGRNFKVEMAVGCLDRKSIVKTKKMFKELKDLLDVGFNGKINADLNYMDKFYEKIDIYILTSLPKSESFGRTLIEAMSKYTVVLTTDAGGPEEIIRDPSNICRTSDEFVNKILDFYHDKKHMFLEKSLNRDWIREKYSLRSNLNKHLKLYRNLSN